MPDLRSRESHPSPQRSVESRQPPRSSRQRRSSRRCTRCGLGRNQRLRSVAQLEPPPGSSTRSSRRLGARTCSPTGGSARGCAYSASRARPSSSRRCAHCGRTPSLPAGRAGRAADGRSCGPPRPLSQLDDQIATLTHARSITARVFTEAEHAQNHVQVGNLGLALRVIVEWLQRVGS